ncbi:DNA mismatch endonuclease Vsr [Apilactobacillus ozensis DSM 23829 = JCM 17196]|uniref:DNA mismatch endonuclease Vsr n=1 Tax=Apilactobacillus ozensis DSM 23829 = JCM 17196 TaxID=1423781 RepID=A0A0R2ALS5_9LACO|nr:very short patch repair endonuclease [Apilactobacillus ozensis]KRM67621.1 DNA mismatch endonuclease Vsr [Apilactobacillus ozensis DSM 23829 = JCM 17196]
MRKDLELRYNLKTDKKTSKRMSKVKLKRGPLENTLAQKLWYQGIRYRRNYKNLPGLPDIAITKYKIAVFIDGEFWNGFNWEQRKQRLKRNREYWINKIETNMKRDKHKDDELRKIGWISLHFWGNTVKNNVDYCIELIHFYIKYNNDL